MRQAMTRPVTVPVANAVTCSDAFSAPSASDCQTRARISWAAAIANSMSAVVCSVDTYHRP